MATETFNASNVKSKMNEINESFVELANTIDDASGKITDNLTSMDGALYGDAADRILATWNENSVTLSSFMNVFDNWSSMVIGIASDYQNLEDNTSLVSDTDIDNIATIASNNRSTWLDTDNAKKYYNKTSYKTVDSETGAVVKKVNLYLRVLLKNILMKMGILLKSFIL